MKRKKGGKSEEKKKKSGKRKSKKRKNKKQETKMSANSLALPRQGSMPPLLGFFLLVFFVAVVGGMVLAANPPSPKLPKDVSLEVEINAIKYFVVSEFVDATNCNFDLRNTLHGYTLIGGPMLFPCTQKGLEDFINKITDPNFQIPRPWLRNPLLQEAAHWVEKFIMSSRGTR